MRAKASCPVCGIDLLTLELQRETNAWAAKRAYDKYPTAGFTYTHQGQQLCHACSEMFKSVLGKPFFIQAQAEMLVEIRRMNLHGPDMSDPFRLGEMMA